MTQITKFEAPATPQNTFIIVVLSVSIPEAVTRKKKRAAKFSKANAWRKLYHNCIHKGMSAAVNGVKKALAWIIVDSVTTDVRIEA